MIMMINVSHLHIGINSAIFLNRIVQGGQLKMVVGSICETIFQRYSRKNIMLKVTKRNRLTDEKYWDTSEEDDVNIN